MPHFPVRSGAFKECQLCGQRSLEISAKIGVCKTCILTNFEKANAIISQVRIKERQKYSLPPTIPKTTKGVVCGDCVNACKIAEGEFGYCKLVTNVAGQLVRLAGDENRGLFSFYYDPLPTNCVAEPFCAGCTSNGFPTFSYSRGPEIGWNNLAVFYQACTYDCLFCQNYQYREGVTAATPFPPKVLVNALKTNTSCICFFGGDPAAQISHSIAVANLAREKAQKQKRILRICWETNGSARPALMRECAQIALHSGGVIKIDIKAFSDKLNIALCGSSNRFSLYNLKVIGKQVQKRPDLPLLVVSTLLIPGYIDVEEVRKLAQFIVGIDPTIPFSLLAFYPTFIMNDLPMTSKKLAFDCLAAAKEEGLSNVHIGNIHLLH